MNAVEIEEAISQLASEPFDPSEFAYAFLEAFGNKATTIKKLRSGNSNKSDLEGGVLQFNNIHMVACPVGNVETTIEALRDSPANKKNKVKFILATDGDWFEAEDVNTGETIACDYADFPNHFGFFLALAGISTVKEIRDSSVDIRATSRLNKLYIELLNHNPDWGKPENRHEMNHFMARLIFCFFAEDTDIFRGDDIFTQTVNQMSDKDSSNTHEVISEIFRAMNTKLTDRNTQNIKRWADTFPYVNGGLFSGSVDVPKFSKIARSYLLHVGSLDWTKINPDIFGSMIQAVADDEERGALGMHYTSVPNILKVLNPLFLDDLREQLTEAGDNARKLLNLRKRIAHIRVFDPACGSGNFLVIAYKQMREIENEINIKRGEKNKLTEIPLTNFRGIELRNFSAEIARLALIIAEYQCDVNYCGQKLALAEFLPLNAENWITQGNALRLDWLSICPPTGETVKYRGDDLFSTPLEQAEIDFENEGGETYICGNPPYKGSQEQSNYQKEDLKSVIECHHINSGSADYVMGWFFKVKIYLDHVINSSSAFVTTNSVHQGRLVGRFWSRILENDTRIFFAESSFLWNNLASRNAAVTVSIIGLTNKKTSDCKIFDSGLVIKTDFISPYLVPGNNTIVNERRSPISQINKMIFGSMPNDGGHLILDSEQERDLLEKIGKKPNFIRNFIGTSELTSGKERYCIWFPDEELDLSNLPLEIKRRIRLVREQRAKSTRKNTQSLSSIPHRFGEVRQIGNERIIAVGGVSTENRKYLPVDLLPEGSIISNLAFGLFDAPLWNMALIASTVHRVWVATVCGKMRIHYRYSNTLGWNTFPVPKLTTKNKEDLTRCAENILLAREAHFPATIADLYNPETMPENLRHAHDRNDEVLGQVLNSVDRFCC